jgi:2OG-Fe(II) oxygenase superfamily
MVRLTLRGTVITATSDDIEHARVGFERHHAVRLFNLLAPDALTFVQRQIEVDGFHERVHETLPGRPVDLILNPGLTSGMLTLIINDSHFLEVARLVTGRREIQSFSGNVHRRIPRAGHGDAWHNDLPGGGLAALTINLGSEPFEGGVLQIREAPDGPVVYEVRNDGPGDAVLFQLSHSLQHRVTDPEGRVPRTVCAGWFRAEPVRQLLRLPKV